MLRSFWLEQRPSTVQRNASDWRLFAVLAFVVLLEGLLREDLSIWSLPFLIGFGLTPLILWRRSHPLITVSVAFVATGGFDAIEFFRDSQSPELNALIYLLVLVYALFRWGAGREVLLGLPIILATATLGLLSDDLSIGEIFGGLAVLIAPMAIGIAVRYREEARLQELEEVRSSERLSLARELHDTVAHHVSGIAVQAQAGVATANVDPKAAIGALKVIQDEASRTLSEMRAMVRILRDGGPAELAPTPGVENLLNLRDEGGAQAAVEVEVHGEYALLSPAVSSAVYRIAQESITNARRHARQATTIQVEVHIDEHAVHLRVTDNGEVSPEGTKAKGFGLMGMSERVQLLGGTLEAGPGAQHGWIVSARLPHDGATNQS